MKIYDVPQMYERISDDYNVQINGQELTVILAWFQFSR